jgi:hypothetical protein
MLPDDDDAGRLRALLDEAERTGRVALAASLDVARGEGEA